MSKKPQTASSDGYIHVDGPLVGDQLDALRRVLAAGDDRAVVVIPRSNLDVGKLQNSHLSAGNLNIHDPDSVTPNRLFGSYINEEGEAV